MQRHKLLCLALTVLSLASCQKFEDLEGLQGAEYDASYALPLINTRLTIQDILQEGSELSALRIDEDGVIHFEYQGDVITQNSDTLFTRINESISGQLIPLFDQRIALPLETAEGTDFDRLVIKEGRLTWGFQNPHPEPVDVTLRMPDVYSPNGDALELTASAPGYSGSGDLPVYTNVLNPFNIAGYEVLPPPGVDSIYVEYELIREGVGPDTIASGAFSLANLTFSYMEGFFGREVQKGGQDTIIIDFFDNWVKGDIYFADPTVTFRIENAFGIPTRSRVNLFNVFTVRGNTLPLEGELVENGIDFSYPSLDQVGEVITEGYVFDRTNSNIDEILGAGPLAIEYDVDAITHPDSNTSIRGFLTDSSFYKVGVEVDLPLFGNAIDFLARDTFDLSLSEFDEAYRAEFKLVTVNELPLDVAIQGYFLDENGMVLDSLFEVSSRVVQGAAADSEGISTGTSEEVTFADFPEERFNRIRATERLEIVALFSTVNEGQQNVKLLARQGIALKLGAIFGRRSE